ncbi:hypothetical protein D3C85_1085780 [compost metagenome]
MIDTWSPWAVIILTGGPIFLAFLSFVLSLYLSHRHLDNMLEALRNSRQIAISAAGLLHHGWFGRMLLVAKITFMVSFPGAGLRGRDLDPDDIRNFPVHLKRWLKAKAVITGIIGVWAAIMVLLVKFR